MAHGTREVRFEQVVGSKTRAQVLTEGLNPPTSIPKHGPGASTCGLVLQALLGNDGTREVCFERVAAG